MYFRSNSLNGLCHTCPNRHFHFCKTLSNGSSTEFNTYAVKKLTYTAKQYVFHQGDINHGLFILQAGWVMLSRISVDGNRQVFRSVLPGELFGFRAHFHNATLYSAIALLDSVVCRIPNIVELCSIQPELSLNISLSVARDLSLTERYLTNINHHSAREKIAFMVLELYHRLKCCGLNSGYSMPFPLRQEDIADTLGLTVIHINRTLHAFREEGLLEIHKHELTILNYVDLCRLVESELEVLVAA